MDTATLDITLREGDIYRWSYREPGDDRSYGRYHCCSNFAIVNAHGRLRDTYWSYGSEGRSFGTEDLPALELKFLANLSDLEKARSYQADYYADADIVNLLHPNGGDFYLRKGAKRCAKKMTVTARRKLEESMCAESAAKRRSEELRKAMVKIDTGELDDVYL